MTIISHQGYNFVSFFWGVLASLTDASLTDSSVASLLNTVAFQLYRCLNIPCSVDMKIRGCCDDKQHQRNQLVQYWWNVSPYASWSFLAGQFHFLKEESALAAAKKYVQRVPGAHACAWMWHVYIYVLECRDMFMIMWHDIACSDVYHEICSSAFVHYTDLMFTLTTCVPHTEPTLTLDNLTSVLEDVQNVERVIPWLQIPPSKQQEINQQYDRITQRIRAYCEYLLTHHPAPSWKWVAVVLWDKQEHGALEMLQKVCLKGKSCSHSWCTCIMRLGCMIACTSCDFHAGHAISWEGRHIPNEFDFSLHMCHIVSALTVNWLWSFIQLHMHSH